MPGFDSKRFVDITDKQREDLMCGICLGILNNPFAARCCKQLYCHDCIHEWLSCSTTCPYDRSFLTEDDLFCSNKVSQQMSSMEIRCEFDECQTVVQLRQLEAHHNYCIHNPERKCPMCGLAVGDSDLHNCIELLKAQNNGLRLENKELKSQLNEFKDKQFEEERQCWDDPMWCM